MTAPRGPFVISVRQPYAWAILHGGKDIENRGAGTAGRLRTLARQPIAIHAASNMTAAEYEAALDFMESIGVAPPHPDNMRYGGIIGLAIVGRVRNRSPSPWFVGPYGIELSDPAALDFIPCRGWPGVFPLEQAGISLADHPALAAAWRAQYGEHRA